MSLDITITDQDELQVIHQALTTFVEDESEHAANKRHEADQDVAHRDELGQHAAYIEGQVAVAEALLRRLEP